MEIQSSITVDQKNIIIGAGICGITLAQRFAKQNLSYLILEKAVSVGGRMATRRDGEDRFDHGAQFVTRATTELIPSSKWVHWISQSAENKYAYENGMNAAAKDFAQGLNVKLSSKVAKISDGQKLQVWLENGDYFFAEKVFITTPLPQALELLDLSNIFYSYELTKTKYAKALVGLFKMSEFPPDILTLKFVDHISETIFSVSNQQSKGLSSGLAFTVTMGSAFSEEHFHLDDTLVLQKIKNEFLTYLNQNYEISLTEDHFKSSQLKKWRYSHPLNPVSTPFSVTGKFKNITLLGDGFLGGSVAKAMESARLAPINS